MVINYPNQRGGGYENTEFLEFINHEDGTQTYRANPTAVGNTFYRSGDTWFYVVGSKNTLLTLTNRYKTLSNQDTQHNQIISIDAGTSGGGVKHIPLNNAITTKLTDLRDLFKDAVNFNQNIGSWDTSNVKTIRDMFAGAKNFNLPIGNWDTSKVTDLYRTFFNAIAFNQNINNWNVSNVTNMQSVFNGASSFNQPIGNWNVSNVTSMHSMFINTVSFNQDLSSWCVSNFLTKPTNFDAGATAWVTAGRQPVWGTCPSQA